MTVHLTWNLVSDVRQLLEFHFMVNALRAGTIVAVVAGAIGYVMVLRQQSFAGHTLAVLGFPGGAAATYAGVAPAYGFFGLCVVAALLIGAVPQTHHGSRSAEQNAVIGVVQACGLAAGFLFVSLYHGFLGGVNSLLFGSLLGVTDDQVLALLVAGVAAVAALGVLWRPLLFASIDAEIARSRGVPVRAVSVTFLVLLGVAAAGASQITGSLLVFALLVAPAATATRLTTRPATGLVLSVAVALVVTWLGAGLAYFSPYPVGFWVTTIAFVAFLLASAYAGVRR